MNLDLFQSRLEKVFSEHKYTKEVYKSERQAAKTKLSSNKLFKTSTYATETD